MNGISTMLAATSKSTSSAAAAGVLGAFAGAAAVVAIVGLVILILTIVAMWKIFTKAGEKGWKAIIPIYNFYILFKICWKPAFFWATLSVMFASGIYNSLTVSQGNNLIVTIISFAFSVLLAVLFIILYYRLCKSFGHGGGWTVGLVFLEPIFIMMLGFGKSEYKGNVYMESKK